MMAALARMRNAIRRDIEAIIGSVAQPRFATVAAVDETTHSVRLEIQPEGVLSGWVPDATALFASGGFGVSAPSRQGDQVKAVYSHGDADFPVVIGRVYSDADPVPVSPLTGDHAKPGEMLISMPGGGWLHFKGDGTVEGGGTRLTWHGPMTVMGDLTVQGAINATGDVVGNGISLDQHVHKDVQPGNGTTGKPQG
jgi:phage baseplate assembly protein gpV